jgi:hypothetical protein
MCASGARRRCQRAIARGLRSQCSFQMLPVSTTPGTRLTDSTLGCARVRRCKSCPILMPVSSEAGEASGSSAALSASGSSCTTPARVELCTDCYVLLARSGARCYDAAVRKCAACTAA